MNNDLEDMENVCEDVNEVFDRNFLRLADECEENLLIAAQPRYCWKIFDMEDVAAIMVGEDIRRHLHDCVQVALFCATLSQGADTCIRAAQAKDVLAGMMTDALASALTEQLCDCVEEEITHRFPGCYTTSRFSPGYGDMPLEVQGEFLGLLQTQKYVGVCMTDTCMMTPTKSVTAVIGISRNPVEQERKGCAACHMVDRCPYRLKGVHCKS